MTEDIRNDFLLFKKLKDNPVHNCVDLSKRMIGTRDGLVYYTQNFRIDFENKMASLAAKDSEINKLNNVIDKIKDITRWLIIIPSRDKEGDYRPIKNTTAQECYKALAEIKEIMKEDK